MRHARVIVLVTVGLAVSTPALGDPFPPSAIWHYDLGATARAGRSSDSQTGAFDVDENAHLLVDLQGGNGANGFSTMRASISGSVGTIVFWVLSRSEIESYFVEQVGATVDLTGSLTDWIMPTSRSGQAAGTPVSYSGSYEVSFGANMMVSAGLPFFSSQCGSTFAASRVDDFGTVIGTASAQYSVQAHLVVQGSPPEHEFCLAGPAPQRIAIPFEVQAFIGVPFTMTYSVRAAGFTNGQLPAQGVIDTTEPPVSLVSHLDIFGVHTAQVFLTSP